MTVEAAVRDELLAALPSLRAYAYSLTGSWDRTDDLVQDTITRAWASLDRFEPGTNLHAWLFKDNPNGMFSPTNPDVNCDDAGNFSLLEMGTKLVDEHH